MGRELSGRMKAVCLWAGRNTGRYLLVLPALLNHLCTKTNDLKVQGEPIDKCICGLRLAENSSRDNEMQEEHLVKMRQWRLYDKGSTGRAVSLKMSEIWVIESGE